MYDSIKVFVTTFAPVLGSAAFIVITMVILY